MLKWLTGGLSRWLESRPSAEKRRAPRLPEPSLLVYYWDGSVPEGRKIRDISITGAYVVTPERWYVGTIVRLILQGYKTTARPQGGIVSSRSTSIPSRVIRHGPDGIGVEFLFSSPEERKEMEAFLTSIPLTQGHANGHVTPADGQALVEFALVLPLMFLLLVNAVNFGAFLFAWITVANSARAGAQYRAIGPAAAGAIAAVACTYQSLIPLWDFAGLGIHATLPATTIHRQVSRVEGGDSIQNNATAIPNPALSQAGAPQAVAIAVVR